MGKETCASLATAGNRKALPARFPAVIGVPIPNTKAFSHFLELADLLPLQTECYSVLECNWLAPKVLILVIRVQVPVEPFLLDCTKREKFHNQWSYGVVVSIKRA